MRVKGEKGESPEGKYEFYCWKKGGSNQQKQHVFIVQFHFIDTSLFYGFYECGASKHGLFDK